MSFSINSLGNNGHLGNQMFQYAFVKGMSVKHSRPFFIPPKEIFGKYYYQKLFSNIDECFNVKCDRKVTEFTQFSERCFEFDEDLFENPPTENTDFIGYFQTEKYFKHIEKEIRNDFSFKENILNDCQESLKDFKHIIGIHIRRNDFVSNKNHPLQDNEYYEKSLLEFDNNIPVIVFSDDIEWCKHQKMFESDRFMISETENPYYDLCLLSLCTHHIICNSTFSWWGAWLAKSKYVIAPKKWFAGDCINHNTKDIYCSNWVVL